MSLIKLNAAASFTFSRDLNTNRFKPLRYAMAIGSAFLGALGLYKVDITKKVTQQMVLKNPSARYSQPIRTAILERKINIIVDPKLFMAQNPKNKVSHSENSVIHPEPPIPSTQTVGAHRSSTSSKKDQDKKPAISLKSPQGSHSKNSITQPKSPVNSMQTAGAHQSSASSEEDQDKKSVISLKPIGSNHSSSCCIKELQSKSEVSQGKESTSPTDEHILVEMINFLKDSQVDKPDEIECNVDLIAKELGNMEIGEFKNSLQDYFEYCFKFICNNDNSQVIAKMKILQQLIRLFNLGFSHRRDDYNFDQIEHSIRNPTNNQKVNQLINKLFDDPEDIAGILIPLRSMLENPKSESDRQDLEIFKAYCHDLLQHNLSKKNPQFKSLMNDYVDNNINETKLVDFIVSYNELLRIIFEDVPHKILDSLYTDAFQIMNHISVLIDSSEDVSPASFIFYKRILGTIINEITELRVASKHHHEPENTKAWIKNLMYKASHNEPKHNLYLELLLELKKAGLDIFDNNYKKTPHDHHPLIINYINSLVDGDRGYANNIVSLGLTINQEVHALGEKNGIKMPDLSHSVNKKTNKHSYQNFTSSVFSEEMNDLIRIRSDDQSWQYNREPLNIDFAELHEKFRFLKRRSKQQQVDVRESWEQCKELYEDFLEDIYFWLLSKNRPTTDLYHWLSLCKNYDLELTLEYPELVSDLIEKVLSEILQGLSGTEEAIEANNIKQKTDCLGILFSTNKKLSVKSEKILFSILEKCNHEQKNLKNYIEFIDTLSKFKLPIFSLDFLQTDNINTGEKSHVLFDSFKNAIECSQFELPEKLFAAGFRISSKEKNAIKPPPAAMFRFYALMNKMTPSASAKIS